VRASRDPVTKGSSRPVDSSSICRRAEGRGARSGRALPESRLVEEDVPQVTHALEMLPLTAHAVATKAHGLRRVRSDVASSAAAPIRKTCENFAGSRSANRGLAAALRWIRDAAAGCAQCVSG